MPKDHSWFAKKPAAKSFKIEAEKAKEMMDSGGFFILADVCIPNEYASGHIEGSVSIPLPEITNIASQILPDKQTPVLVYCQSGRRSAQAVEILDRMGYTNVRDIGGIMHWPYRNIVRS